MQQICSVTGTRFTITEAELQFYHRMGVSPPRLSPLERQRRRTVYRNFRDLHRGTCALTGQPIISMYDRAVPFPVFSTAAWFSDSWDPRSYGTAYDHSKTFFDNYSALSAQIPRFALMNLKSENCDYCNMVMSSKNCYLVFGCVRSEDCLYGHIIWDCSNCVDSLYLFRCQWCSNSRDLVDCYDVHYSAESSNCRESYFLYDCAQCSNCYACYNLRGKQYCFYNEQCSKEEYYQRLSVLSPLSRDKVAAVAEWLDSELRNKAIFPDCYGVKAEECAGNHIYESRSAHYCFDTKQSEDSYHCFTAFGQKDCCDISFTGSPASHSLECLTVGNSSELMGCHNVMDSHSVAYSEFCYSSKDLFGCNGIKHGQYLILNKQYSKDDYKVLRDKIVAQMTAEGSWGEFFPASLSPFAYNQSTAQEYQPLTETETRQRGFRWHNEEATISDKAAKFSPDDFPEDTALTQTFSCRATGKAYRIVTAELEFARKMKLPISDLAPNERHRRLLAARADRRVIERSCDQCGTTTLTAHTAELAKHLYCHSCYVRAVFG